MSDEIRLFHGSTAAAHRPVRRRVGYLVTGGVLLAALGGAALWIASSQPVLPDRLQVLSALPVPGKPGDFKITARLSRADGGRIAAFSSGADLIDPATKRQLVGRQCGFDLGDRSDRYLDVVLQGSLKPHTRTVSALVTVEVRAVPLSEQLHWMAHSVSGKLIPPPRILASAAPVLSCPVQMPPDGVTASR